MEDDYSDILGSGVLNVKPQSRLSFSVKASLSACTLFILYLIGASAWNRFLKWRERSYRLAMRRKHGIPDDDHRPFNVAYAAVQRAREQREALKRLKARPMNSMSREQLRPSAQPNQDLRQRTGVTRNVGTTWTGGRSEMLPGGYYQPTPQQATAGPSRQNHNGNDQPAVSLNEGKVLYPRATELVSSTNYPIPGSVRVSKGQKGLEGDTKRRSHAYMDSEQNNHVGNSSREGNGEPLGRAGPKRGSKREYGDAEEAEDVVVSKRAREKRARKVSLEKEIPGEDMEVDEHEVEDGFTDHDYLSRGKKRDRDEAGSTFGGDEEDESELEEAEDDAMARRRSRKRRSVAKRKSDLALATRGKKRDRGIEDDESDDGSDHDHNRASSRKRRNKQEGRLGDVTDGDVSMEESPVKGKGRKIGEEWTSNGVLYKIGPNGQRLRQALVKKARQKYNMPEDSQHPDRDANLEVYVETWLTEEGYQDAKARHSLAWQDTPKASMERDTHVENTQPPPSPVGKSLLWKSAATPPAATPDGGSPTDTPATPVSKGKFAYDPRRQSIAVDVAMRVNPFQQYPAQTSKRIASGRLSSAGGGAGLVDSTNNSPRVGHRIYSKWEKQDLEANAMMKMREAARRKEAEEKDRQEKEYQEKEQVEREKAEKEKAATPVPIITITKPAEDKPAQGTVPNFFTKPVEPAKDAAKPPMTTASPFTLPTGFPQPTEKTTTPTENKLPSFPLTQPAATPFSFSKPGPTPFLPVPKPTEDSTKSTEQPKPSPFTQPQVSAMGMPSATPSAPAFSFSKAPIASEQKQGQQSGPGAGASLLSRLQTVAPDSSSGSLSQPSTTFSFAKPSEPHKSSFFPPQTSASILSAQPSTGATMAATPSNSGTSSSTMKFDFKLPNKPSATSAALRPATVDTSKPAASNIFSFKPPTGPATESAPAFSSPAATASSSAATFPFGSPSNAFSNSSLSQAPIPRDAITTKVEGVGSQGVKPIFTFSGIGTPGDTNSKPALGNTSALNGRSALPTFSGFGNSTDSNTKSAFSGFGNAQINAPSASATNTGGDDKAKGFSAFSTAQVPSTSDASAKPSPFGSLSFGSGIGTSTPGLGGQAAGSANTFAGTVGSAFTPPQPPTLNTVVSSVAPASNASDVSKPTAFGFPAPKDSNSTTTSTSTPKFSFGFNNVSTLNKASEGAAPNPSTVNTFTPETTRSLFKFTPTSTPGSGGAGQSTFNPTANATQTAFQAPATSQPLSTFGLTTNTLPSSFGTSVGGQSGLGSASNSQPPTFGVPSGGQFTFGSMSSPKPNATPAFGMLGAQSASGSNTSGPSTTTPTFTFGQTSMNSTTNNAGGQS